MKNKNPTDVGISILEGFSRPDIPRKELFSEYYQLSVSTDLSEVEEARIDEILALAEEDKSFAELLSKVDQLVYQKISQKDTLNQLASEYYYLSVRTELSEIEEERIDEILSLAEEDSSFAELLRRVDKLVYQKLETGLSQEEHKTQIDKATQLLEEEELEKINDAEIEEYFYKQFEPWKYWQLPKVTSSGNLKIEEVPTAKAFFYEQLLPLIKANPAISERSIQNQLVHLAGMDKTAAKICLRCRISNDLKINCLNLVKRFKPVNAYSSDDEHNQTHKQGYDQVIDPLQNHYHLTDQELYVSFLDGLKHPSSLIDKILDTFDPTKGNLSTWTTRLFRNDRMLKRILLEHGIQLVTDWSILINAKPKKLKQILEDYNRSAREIENAISLLNSFQYVYPTKDLAYHQKGKSCPAPTQEQLIQTAAQLSMSEPLTAEEVENQLKELALVLRREKIDRPQLSIPDYSKSDGLAALLRPSQSKCLEKAVNQVLETRMSNFARSGLKGQRQAKEFKQILELFYCENISTIEIAQQLEIDSQSMVSRTLNRSKLQADISRNFLHYWSHDLFEKVSPHLSPDQLKNWAPKVREFLEPKVIELTKEADRQAQASKNRCLGDPLSVAICRYITKQKQMDQQLTQQTLSQSKS